MTWVSLRSGVASSGTVVIAHQPATHAAATTAQTRILLLTEKSMIRLIMAVRLQLFSTCFLNRGETFPPKPHVHLDASPCRSVCDRRNVGRFQPPCVLSI